MAIAPAPGLGSRSRRLARLLAITAVVGLLAGADPLLAWTQAPDAAKPDWLQGWAESWEQAANRLGLNLPYRRLRAARDAIESVRFAPAPD